METLYDVSGEELEGRVVALGEAAYRARQVREWAFRRFAQSYDEMTNVPAGLRARLAAELPFPSMTVVAEVAADDGLTRKRLIRLGDGKLIETVLMLYDPRSDSRGRATVCVSSQAGCAMGCVFCASGVAGLKRHLGAHEIVAQVLEGRRRLDADESLRNVVFMGMGEPLHNYAATAAALRVLVRDDGIGLSSRRVTVSTSGLVPEIDRLGAEFGGQVTLAVSLHATTDEARSALMPINKKYPLDELMAALRRYPLPRRRRITIEFTLVAGRNDDVAEAKRLAALLRGVPVKINLIPMNPIEASTLGPPDLAGVLAFQRVLLDAGYSCFVRRRRGDDVSAACGQLALLGAQPRKRRA